VRRNERNMSFHIALAGKGGTGKTTVATLVIRYLVEHGLGPVLAVDADANTNLNEMLGIEVGKMVGEAREEMKTQVPVGMTKEVFMEYKVQEALVECKGFDLIAMGRPEGAGCYCYANSLLNKYLDILLENYRYVVMDNEAGLEHISRLTTRDVDLMLVVTDPTKRGILTAGRIKELTRELKLNIGNLLVVVNRSDGVIHPAVQEQLRVNGLTLAGVIPADDYVRQFDLEGKPMVHLPTESLALQALFRIMDGILPNVRQEMAVHGFEKKC
jgi:CO dehydrogenase maturation factor